MEITREKNGELTELIKMKVNAVDYNEKVDKVLKDYQRKANVPGFRPGHVPFGMIKKLYGTAVFAEQVNTLISDKLHEYILEEKMDVLGQPLPNETLTPQVEWKDGQELEFYFDLGLAPEFDVVLNDKISMDYHVIKVDDKMLEKYTEDMRQRFGTMKDSETAGEKDMLFGQFAELASDGTMLKGGITHETRVAVDKITDNEVQSKLLGSKVGDVVVFNPLKATGNLTETASMLAIEKFVAAELESDFSFTISEISHMEPAEMNAEFFEKVFPGSELTDEEGFLDKVRSESELAFVADSDHLFIHTMQEKLVASIAMPLPDEFLKRWLFETNSGKLTEEEILHDYTKYADGMKWQLIENRIIRDAEIEVSDEEIKDYVKDYYLQGWRTMPLTEDLMNRLDSIATSFMKDKPKEVRQIMDSIYGQRVAAYVKAKVKLVEKEISYDEFVKLDAEKH